MRIHQIGDRLLHPVGIIIRHFGNLGLCRFQNIRIRQTAIGSEFKIAPGKLFLQPIRHPEQPHRRLVLAEFAGVLAGVYDFAIRFAQFAPIFFDKSAAAATIRAKIGRRIDELARTFDDFLNPLKDDIRRERLGHKLVDPGVACGRQTFPVDHAADHHDGDKAVGRVFTAPNPAQQHIPVDARHHHIGNHDINTATAHRLQSTGAQLQDFDGFLTVLGEVVVPDAQGIHNDPQVALHELVVLHQQAGHTTEIITHGRSRFGCCGPSGPGSHIP